MHQDRLVALISLSQTATFDHPILYCQNSAIVSSNGYIALLEFRSFRRLSEMRTCIQYNLAKYLNEISTRSNPKEIGSTVKCKMPGKIFALAVSDFASRKIAVSHRSAKEMYLCLVLIISINQR